MVFEGAKGMQDNEDDLPALVFSGAYSEVVFLKSLLESAAIETSLETSRRGGDRLYVRRRDAEHAQELIADFMRNGKRTL